MILQTAERKATSMIFRTLTELFKSSMTESAIVLPATSKSKNSGHSRTNFGMSTRKETLMAATATKSIVWCGGSG